MYTHSRHSVTNSHGYVRHAEIKDNSVLPGGEQRGLFLYSLSELLEIQGGEIHLTIGRPSLINQSCYVVLYILRNSVLAMVRYNNAS